MPSPAFIRPEVAVMAGYIPGEQPRDREYVKLNTNENPYPPSERVLDAVRTAVTGDLRLYPDPTASALRARASGVYGVPADWILAGNGSDELLSVILRACVSERDSVCYATPTYSLYDTLVALQGATAIRIPFNGAFDFPGTELARAAAKVTIVCNPNAPSGTLFSLSDIDKLAASVSGLVVVDEAYVDFAQGSALSLVERHANLVVLRTFSKSFSLCGLRIGLAFARPAVLGEFAKVRDSYSVNQLGLVAAAAALEDYESMRENVARVRESRLALTAELAARGFQVLPSETNFVLARRPGHCLSRLYGALKERGVLVRYFSVPELRDAVRITVGTPGELQRLLVAIDAIRDAPRGEGNEIFEGP